MSGTRNTNSSSEAFEALKVYLTQNFRAKLASGGKEIVKRCHFCGDSRDQSDAHLYIGLKNDGSIAYHCFKCNASGYVDGRFLRDMGCYDTSIMNLCLEQNRNSLSSRSSRLGSLRDANTFRHPYIYADPNSEYTMKKLNYISNRLGVPFTLEMLSQFKIVLNLKEFLGVNRIDRYTRQPDMIDLMDKFFMGFLSMDNCYVNLRRLVPEGKLPQFIDSRFINYNIFGINDNSRRYYVIPNMVDTTMPIDVHIAEGGFDILSIYLNLPHENPNAIYIAICGKSYEAVIRFLIVTYGLSNFNLHIYPDADINSRKMYDIKNLLIPFNVNIFVHRNGFEGEKDYGVSKDRIVDLVTKI